MNLKKSAALLEQLPNGADVFTTSVSNIPKSSIVEVSITYIQELKHDAEVDGVRLTVPTSISPQYGLCPGELMEQSAVDNTEGMSLTIYVRMVEGFPIKKIMSPSHPNEVSLGCLSGSTNDEYPSLEKDFVLQAVAKDVGIPQATLEIHPMLLNQRAVPMFNNLKPHKPEIIFLADRSGSMDDNIPTLISAMNVFLKSIPVGRM
ncbi:von willebrand domain containing protein [Paraphaeosphaeria minitans]|uniref:von willebrand domain containing protein n=1 Tax=Paraphaeosphaeria minitans TaxID=565426 RepID=A0A9P6GG26_9PLEO|nr:von willebrand domain containing protein [Paraphaeosphaeria minitans]